MNLINGSISRDNCSTERPTQQTTEQTTDSTYWNNEHSVTNGTPGSPFFHAKIMNPV